MAMTDARNMGGRAAQVRRGAAWRIGLTISWIIVTQSVVIGLAVFLPAILWRQLLALVELEGLLWSVVFAFAAAPAYGVFALSLMFVSAAAGRVLGWRAPEDAEMRISDMSWPLLRWVEYMVAIHVVRFFVGGLLKGTPVWTAYLRLAGARLGRRVYVNSLGLSDYNLLEFGDDVVIGADAHVGGHTVERGIVKTARIRLGRGVTIGIGTIVDIGVDAGDGCQVAALSLVPKHTKLVERGVYAGIPVRRIDAS
jgi:hypothetical protein